MTENENQEEVKEETDSENYLSSKDEPDVPVA